MLAVLLIACKATLCLHDDALTVARFERAPHRRIEFSEVRVTKGFWDMQQPAQSVTALTSQQKVAVSERMRSKVQSMGGIQAGNKAQMIALLNNTAEDWRAALRIQASFRAWQWRKQVLWNPHDPVGRKRLQQIAAAHCS